MPRLAGGPNANLKQMKTKLILLSLLIAALFGTAGGQKRVADSGRAVVVDERLAVLRAAPGFFARPLQRLGRGREVTVSGSRKVDGAVFLKVAVGPRPGWIQGEAVAGRFRLGDDERLLRLVGASAGFAAIQRAQIFLRYFPDSRLRPAMLLLFGDLVEEEAAGLSRQATRRLKNAEMAASGAPLHSFYLNFAPLDRYRRLGIVFLLNPATLRFHYDGAVWREIVAKHPASPERGEAEKRLADLKSKMAAR